MAQNYINKINVDSIEHLIEPTLYVAPTLSSSAYSASLDNFALITGATIQAKFAATNPANATLNINSTGTKNIFYNNAKITASQFKANHVYTLVYDGTQWQVVGDIDTNTWRGIQDNLTSSTNTSESLSAKQGYLLANGSARDNTKLPLAGGTLTGRVTTEKVINHAVIGSGTVGSYTNSTYYPAKWTFNTGMTAQNGDIITIKLPCAGHDYGVFMSIDNGTNYYPVVLSGTNRVTTQYPNGGYITVIFNSSGSAASMFALAGQTSSTRITVNGGVWQVLNYYDSGNSGLYQNYNIKAYKVGSTAITAYDLIAEDINGYLIPAHKIAHRVGCPIFIRTEALSANATGSWTALYDRHSNITIRKDGNNLSLTTYAPVFLKGTISNGMFTPDTTTPYINTKANCNVTGAYYMYIGDATGSTTISYNSNHPYYYYNGTNLILYTEQAGNAVTVNGLTVQTAVPVNALFTDTNKYHKSGSWSGLTYTATAVNSADELKFTIPDNYGDTKNPYASKTKNYVLAAPSNANGAPSFRALVAADIPDLSSTYLKLDGSNNMTADINIIAGDTDKFINFWYYTDKKAGASWRIGELGSGSQDTNYFVIQSGTSTTTDTNWTNALRIGMNTHNVYIPSTTASTSTSTGALTIEGGLGVAGQVTADTLQAGNLTIGGTAGTVEGKTISSSSTIYFDRTTDYSIIFRQNGESKITVDTNNALRPYINNTLSVGTSDYKWANIYASNLHGNLEVTAHTNTTNGTKSYYPWFSTTTSGNLTAKAHSTFYLYEHVENTKISQMDVCIGKYDIKGTLTLWDGSDHWANINITNLSANRTYIFPDKAGTIALTSDLPTWSSLGGGDSGKHEDSYFVKAIADSTSNAIVRFNGTSGQVRNSSVIINDNGIIKTLGTYVHRTSIVNQSGYIKFLTLTVSQAYVNRGFEISYTTRSRLSGSIHCIFSNVNNKDPDLTIYKTGTANIYYIKSATSTWDIYIDKSESYEDCIFTIVNPGQLVSNDLTSTWVSEHVTTLPEGYLTATKFTQTMNISGNATNVTETVAIANGGTGVTDKANIFTAMSWTNGTTAGPTLSATVLGQTRTATIPAASASASGVITTGNQVFNGTKTFSSTMYRKGNNSGTATNYAETYITNNAGTIVAQYYYSFGDVTNITSGKYYWRQYSPQSTPDTTTTGKHETYYLPEVTKGLTENKSYAIITTKNLGNITATGTITSGTWNASVIGAAYGGTGQNTLQKSANALINALDTGASDLTANDYVITQYVGGGTTTTSYHRRPANKVINATLVKAALGTVGTTARKFLKDTGAWVQVDWEDLTGKPTSFSPAEHNHSQIKTVGDNRAVATTPNNYKNALIFQGLKNKSTINNPSNDTYSYLIGLRGWSDSSGGDAHELAFNNNGINWRHGATDTWSEWKTIAYTDSTVARATADASGNTITSTYAPLASPALTGTPTAPTAADGTSTTQLATTAFVMNQFRYNDSMVYKGVVNANSNLPATHYQGWTYKVGTAGTYAGIVCEVGDMIICNTDGTSANNAHWNVIQTNIDGAVTGPAESIANQVAVFSSNTGKVITNTTMTYNNNNLTIPIGNTTISEGISIVRSASADSGLTARTIMLTMGHEANGGNAGLYDTTKTKWIVYSNKEGNVILNGNANTATTLQTGRTLKVALGSTGASTAFNGSANITDIGVSGTLAVANGGTGNTTFTAGNIVYAKSASQLASTSYMHLNYTAGTTSNRGAEELVIGNSTDAGTANNALGRIALYSGRTKGSYITVADITSGWVNHKLPATSGWLVVAGNGSDSGAGASDRPVYISTAGVATQTTYRMAATNVARTSAVLIQSSNGSNENETGIWYVSGTSNILGYSDGAVITNKYNDSWVSQIYQDYRTGQIALRGKNNGTWQNWRKVLDTENWQTTAGIEIIRL